MYFACHPTIASAQEFMTISENFLVKADGTQERFGVLGPAGMARALVDRLNVEINRIVKDPKFVKEKLLSAGLEPMGGTPQQLHEILQGDIAKYARIARDAKIQPE